MMDLFTGAGKHLPRVDMARVAVACTGPTNSLQERVLKKSPRSSMKFSTHDTQPKAAAGVCEIRTGLP